MFRGLLLSLLLGWAFTAAADIAVPPLTGRVVDTTDTLTNNEIGSLTRKLEDFENRKGSQIAVLMLSTTQPETIEQYSIRVADAWKVGRKNVDDGAILVVAKQDRQVRIEVGYGLEGSLTDATSRRIIDEDIIPKFRTGDFYGGISAGVDRIMQVIDGEKLPTPKSQQWENPISASDLLGLIFFLLITSGVLRAVLGRLVGSAATGVLIGVVAWMIIGSVAVSVILGLIAFVLAFIVGAASGGYSGGWAGGAWSGGSGGSGSSRGSGNGFSGGGGSFGGGGASGRW